MPLKSKLFFGDAKLDACLKSDPAHIVPGSQGQHVEKIQKALVTLGSGIISKDEITSQYYGASTINCVLKFKGPPRNILQWWQRTPDNIVGKRTIAKLDEEMLTFENRPPQNLGPFSLYISLTEDGQPHDHVNCPITTWSTIKSAVQHKFTPIYPRGTRRINIGGEKETEYLMFKDYLVRRVDGNYYGYMRPFTETLPNAYATDICMRATLLTEDMKVEILRIAEPGCRFTYASPNRSHVERARGMGRLIEFWDIQGEMPAVVVEL